MPGILGVSIRRENRALSGLVEIYGPALFRQSPKIPVWALGSFLLSWHVSATLHCLIPPRFISPRVISSGVLYPQTKPVDHPPGVAGDFNLRARFAADII